MRRKEVKGLFFLLVSITVFFGLSSVGCKKESEKPGSTTFTNPADATTNSTFAKTIGGSDLDEAYSIIQSSDGGYVVAGRTRSFGAGYSYDFYVVKMDANGNVCFSQNITNYSVSSNVGSFSSASKVAISQSPRVKSISPTVSYGGSVSDVCPSAPAPR